MNLISCTHCGVVFDKDYLVFPDVYNIDNGDCNVNDNAVWDGDKFIATTPCIICGNLLKEDY